MRQQAAGLGLILWHAQANQIKLGQIGFGGDDAMVHRHLIITGGQHRVGGLAQPFARQGPQTARSFPIAGRQGLFPQLPGLGIVAFCIGRHRLIETIGPGRVRHQRQKTRRENIS